MSFVAPNFIRDLLAERELAGAALFVLEGGADFEETIEHFRAHFPQVRIIAMSGNQPRMQSYLPVAEVAGAQATLQKPFSGAALLETLKKL